MKRLACASVLGWLAVAGCSPAAPTGLFFDSGTDAGARPDVPTTVDAGDAAVKPVDVPVVRDVPVVTDVTKGDDVPPAVDGGVDVPATTDDVPVTTDDVVTDIDVPVVTPDVPPPPVDVPVGLDVPVVTPDVPPPPVDVPPPPVDVPPTNPCLAPVNLNAAGTLTGSVLHYTGNNAASSAATDYHGTCSQPGHVVAFAYTPRTTTRLHVSTNNPGTPTTFDTVVFAQDRCVATGATSLGCDDDINAGDHTRASDFVTPAVAAGTTVYLFVAGYEPPTNDPWTSTGAFELTVGEAVVVPAGTACDPAGALSVCAPGSSCRAAGGGNVCLADGALGAGCRAAAPRCDGALVCNASSVCQNADGATGGACRLTGTPCDAGLACATGPRLCRPAVADNGACDPTGATNACLPSASCAPPAAGGAAVCRRLWTETAIAAPTFLDACTTGTHVVLDASSARDDNHSAAAVTIPWSFPFYGTAQTMFWPDTNGFIQFGAMAPDDDTGGARAIPDTAAGPRLAVFWDDLTLGASPASDICVATVGATPDRRVVVEWLDAARYSATGTHITMEAVLYERGAVIDLIYSRLEAPAASAAYVDGSRATVGLQSANAALSVVHVGTVSTTAGIRFTPVP